MSKPLSLGSHRYGFAGRYDCLGFCSCVVCRSAAEMSCDGSGCESIVNSTNLEVNTTSTGDCETVAVSCPLSGQRLASLVSVYTCRNGVWSPWLPRSCTGLYSAVFETKSSADAEGSRDAPEIRNIAHEKACNRETTFKDTQCHRC